MKKIIPFIIFLLYLSGLYSQAIEQPVLFNSNGKWGYLDHEGKIAIPFEYSEAGEFSSGLAPVRKGAYWNYINYEGKVILDGGYSYASQMHNGVALVYHDANPAIIDSSGTRIIEGYKNVIISETAPVIWCEDSLGQWYIHDHSGKPLQNGGPFKRKGEFSEGYASVISTEDNGGMINGKFIRGLIDYHGNWIIPYGEYRYIGKVHNAFTMVDPFLVNGKENRDSWKVYSIETGEFERGFHFEYDMSRGQEDNFQFGLFALNKIRYGSEKLLASVDGTIYFEGEDYDKVVAAMVAAGLPADMVHRSIFPS